MDNTTSITSENTSKIRKFIIGGLVLSILFFIVGIVLFFTLFLPTVQSAKGFTKSQCTVTNITIDQNSSESCSSLDSNVWWTFWLGFSSFNGGSSPGGSTNNLVVLDVNSSLYPISSVIVEKLENVNYIQQSDDNNNDDTPSSSSSSTSNFCYQVVWSVFFKDTVEGDEYSKIESLWTNQEKLARTWASYYGVNSNHLCFYDKNNIEHASWTQLPSFLYVWTISFICIGFVGLLACCIAWIIVKRKEKKLFIEQDIKHLYRDSQYSIDYRATKEPLLIEHQQQQQRQYRSNSNGSNNGSNSNGSQGSYGKKRDPGLPIYSFNHNLRYSKDLALEINNSLQD